MSKRQQALFADVVPSENEKLRAFMRKLGISELPTYEMKDIPPENIAVPGVELISRPYKMMRSIEQVGILHAPAVVRIEPIAPGGEDTKFYEVVVGRRRVLSTQLLTLPLVECKLYDRVTPQLRSVLVLIENLQRRDAWVKEVEDLALLIGDRVAMTLDDLVELGFDSASLKERLKIARLPQSILRQILEGHAPYRVAKMITRLSEQQQCQLLSLIEDGGVIEEDLIKSLLRSQINPGLPQVQMELAPPSHGEKTARLEAIDAPSGDALVPAEVPSLAQVLDVLQAYELHPEKVDQSTKTLLRALIQRLRVLHYQQAS
jgi:hypothetical protein